MSLLMEALRKAEEAKRKSQNEEGAAPGRDGATAPPDSAQANVASPAAAPADAASPFSLEPREPSRIPPPFYDTDEPAGAAGAETGPEDLHSDAGPAVVIEAPPHDEIEEYLSGDLAPEDNRPLPRETVRKQTRQSRDQLAAASVFAAKQQTRQPQGNKRKRLAALFGGGLTLVCIGAGVLWYLQQGSSSGIAVNPGLANFDMTQRSLSDSIAETTQVSTDVASAGAASEPLAASAASDPAAPDQASTATGNASEQPVATTSAAAVALEPTPPEEQTALSGAELAAAAAASGAPRNPPMSEVPAIEAPADATPAVPAANPAAPPVAAPARTLQITRSSGRSEPNNTLQAAWTALQAGERQRAELLYRETLAEQPNNRDALLGLAAIQLGNADLAQATALYAQALRLNPQDPYARAGLLQSTRGGTDPAYETELRSLLQRHPDLAPLHFALGNHYAARQRWSEAQAAYFEALLQARRDSTTPVSPDYAFNLAVSLERLQQPEAALTYYGQALELSRSSPPGFDPALLQSRLQALQEQTRP